MWPIPILTMKPYSPRNIRVGFRLLFPKPVPSGLPDIRANARGACCEHLRKLGGGMTWKRGGWQALPRKVEEAASHERGTEPRTFLPGAALFLVVFGVSNWQTSVLALLALSPGPEGWQRWESNSPVAFKQKAQSFLPPPVEHEQNRKALRDQTSTPGTVKYHPLLGQPNLPDP